MEDVNDLLVAEINDMLEGSGMSMDEVENGLGFGVEAGADLPMFAFGIGYERLMASTDVGNSEATIELKFPGNAFYGLVEYRLRPRVRWGPAGRAGGWCPRRGSSRSP